MFAIPVAPFGRVDRGSEVEVDAGAHAYQNGPKDVQLHLNPPIWKAMVAHSYYSTQDSPLISALCVAKYCPVGITLSVDQLRAWDEVGDFCPCTLQPLNCPEHARVLFCYHLRSPPTSWHYLHRSYPLPEHRRKGNDRSGACIPVFCHLVSAGENGTRR